MKETVETFKRRIKGEVNTEDVQNVLEHHRVNAPPEWIGIHRGRFLEKFWHSEEEGPKPPKTMLRQLDDLLKNNENICSGDDPNCPVPGVECDKCGKYRKHHEEFIKFLRVLAKNANKVDFYIISDTFMLSEGGKKIQELLKAGASNREVVHEILRITNTANTLEKMPSIFRMNFVVEPYLADDPEHQKAADKVTRAFSQMGEEIKYK